MGRRNKSRKSNCGSAGPFFSRAREKKGPIAEGDGEVRGNRRELRLPHLSHSAHAEWAPFFSRTREKTKGGI